jgi:hypothetical protein
MEKYLALLTTSMVEFVILEAKRERKNSMCATENFCGSLCAMGGNELPSMPSIKNFMPYMPLLTVFFSNTVKAQLKRPKYP